MNSRNNPFYSQVQLFEIQGNIVIARPKVASSTCSSITYNKFDGKIDYHIYIIEQESVRDNYDKLPDEYKQSGTKMAKFN